MPVYVKTNIHIYTYTYPCAFLDVEGVERHVFRVAQNARNSLVQLFQRAQIRLLSGALRSIKFHFRRHEANV